QPLHAERKIETRERDSTMQTVSDAEVERILECPIRRDTDDDYQRAMRELAAERVRTAIQMRPIADSNPGHVGKAFTAADGSHARCDHASKTVLDEANERAEQRIRNQWRAPASEPRQTTMVDHGRPFGTLLDEADARAMERIRRQQGRS